MSNFQHLSLFRNPIDKIKTAKKVFELANIKNEYINLLKQTFYP